MSTKWTPTFVWWPPTTHAVTMPSCVYRYCPSSNINKVTQDTYHFCYTCGSNVITTLQLDKSPQETLMKSQVGKSGWWIFSTTCQFTLLNFISYLQWPELSKTAGWTNHGMWTNQTTPKCLFFHSKHWICQNKSYNNNIWHNIISAKENMLHN